MRRWYRDPSLPLPRTEVTRFPHGVLEVKLSLPEGQNAPDWVQDLLDSGYLTEVRHPMQRRLSLARLGGAGSCSCHFLLCLWRLDLLYVAERKSFCTTSL